MDNRDRDIEKEVEIINSQPKTIRAFILVSVPILFSYLSDLRKKLVDFFH